MWWLWLACATAPAPTTPAVSAPPAALAYVERGAGPLVVVMHGFGDVPEHLRDAVVGCALPVRVVAPRAPTPAGDGFSWFERRVQPDGTRGWDVAGIEARTDELAALIRTLSPTHRAVVTGFSQGGVLSFAMATRHPEAVVAAIPVSGAVPDALVVAAPPAAPPIRALHGLDDDVLEAMPAIDAVRRLRDLGWDAEIATFPGVRHAIPPEVHAAWCAAIGDATR